MKSLSRLCWTLAVTGIAAVPAGACNEGSVRDAALQSARDVHRLCVIANAEDEHAAQICARLQAWLDGFDNGLNIRLERINADDPSLLWPSLGIPSAPAAMPVVALVGMSPATHLPFVIDHWEPEPTGDALAVLATSPAREAILRETAHSWAVLVYSSASGTEDGALAGLLNRVAEKWAREHPLDLGLVRLNRSDPRERLLCAFTGIAPDTPDWVGVVFGRGKLMAPPLERAEITEPNLAKLVEGLSVPCTCLQYSLSFGLDIPMAWDSAFDPPAIAVSPGVSFAAAPFEERVMTLQEEVKDDSSLLYLALLPLMGLAVVAAGASVVLVLRRRGSRAHFLEE